MTEKQAVKQVIQAGKAWGYGNMISILKARWAIDLMDSGLPVKAALLGAFYTEEEVEGMVKNPRIRDSLTNYISR